jgi:PAS domain S-box-containing protein
MISRIRKLKPENQQILMIAACIGHKFSLDSISLVAEQSPEQIITLLDTSIKEGLIFSYDHVYNFLHDRIHESVYSLIEPSRRAEIHLQLGRIFYSRSVENANDKGLFDTVNQYNLGSSLIQTHEENKLLKNLNFSAGIKAKAATAYASAKEYFKLSAELMDENSWTSDYKFTFDLYLNLSECEFLLGNFYKADEIFNWLLNHAESKIDKTKVYRLRTILYQVAGRYQAAVENAIDGLKLFSINLPESQEEIQKAIEEEVSQIPENLNGRTVKDLLNAPEASDPDARSIIGLMAEMASPAYNVRSKYFNLIYLKGYNKILKYGNTEDAAYLLAFYALLRIGLFNDIPSAFEYSELSLKLNDKYKNTKLTGRLYNMNAISINYKRRHFATGIPIFKHGFDSSLEVGDFVYASYISFTFVWHHIETEISLNEILRISKKYTEFNKQKHNTTIYYVIRQYEQFIACLQGTTQGLLSFNDSTYNETEALSIFKKAQYGPGPAIYFILKQIVSFTFCQYKEAYEFAQLAKDKLPDIKYAATEGQYPFFYALTLSSLYPNVSDEKKKEFINEIKVQLELLKLWSDNSPDNFYNRYALVEAELASLEEKDLEAMRWYEEAIKSAVKNGFLFKSAMAYELAAKFYKNRGFEKIANSYLTEAYNLYSQWKAYSKCSQLEEIHPFLKKQKIIPTSFGLQVPQLDLLSIIKASQIISGEMDLRRLVENLMNIVLEQAGAEKASLLLIKEEQLWLISEAVTSKNELHIRNHLEDGIFNPSNLPDSILQYVKRTKEKTILNDASTSNLFSNDRYILTHRPKSIACIPIIKQGKLIGILYLENNLFTSAFLPDKILILELLASQAAISIENSMLFTELANSKQILQDMMNNSSASIFIKDLHGKYIFINKVYKETMKMSPNEVIGKTPYDVWQKDIADQLTDHDIEVLKAGKPITFEEMGLPIHGTLQTNISVRFPVYDMNGKIYAIGGISTDITDRKSAEEALRERESRIRRLVESNIIGIYFWDAGGVITETNDAFAQLIGYSSEEITRLKLDWKQLCDKKYIHAIDKAKEELDNLGTSTPFETEFTRKDKSHVPVLVAGTLLQKGIDQGIGFVLNLTDLKKAEDEIRRLNIGLQDRIKELTQSKQELERLNIDLLKTNTDLDNFIYAASHNVRGPASSLEGLINVLDLKLYNPDELSQIVKMMKSLMSTFNQTINDLTELSKVQKIIENKDIVENDIKKVIDEIKEEIKVQIESSGASFITDFHEAPTLLYSYNNFKRILFNLIINSITYSSPLRKPEIVIRSSQNQEYVIVSITDNGLGIHPKYFEKIFEMFKRAHDHVEGRGIGLYIVKRIMENSNGKIQVESEVNKGSTFTLYFKK